MSTGVSDLVKEGTKFMTGHEVVIQNIEAVNDFTKITRTSFGPQGLNKMVVNHLSKLFVTSDAATIIKELDVFHPAAKLAVLASQMQEQEAGDGTNLVLIFCGELLMNAQELIKRGLHPSDIVAGYSKASQKALDLLQAMGVHKIENITNVDEVTKFIKSAIASKQFGYEDMLSPIIAKACIDVLPKNPQHFNVDNVRVAKILGGGVLDTQVIKGHVLVRDAEGTVKHMKNAKIAVFAAGIDVPKPETKDTVLIKNAEELLNYSKSEEKKMEDLLKQIADAGVNVVVSGGAIGEMAFHFIERHGMMAVKTPSKFELRRICKAIGATPLVRLGAPTAEELGKCDIVTTEEIGSTKVTVFRQDTGERSGIATIIVRASTQNILDDIERAIDDGVNVFKGLVKDPRFVPGAGATEIELSRQIQTFGDNTPGLSQYAIKKYGESFEVVPRTLAENAGQKAIDTIASLYAAHSKGNSADGLNVEDGSIQSAVQLGIFDLLSTKVSAIRLATSAAITVLQVDQIIMAKPAGGPKPPKQGPMDADD